MRMTLRETLARAVVAWLVTRVLELWVKVEETSARSESRPTITCTNSSRRV